MCGKRRRPRRHSPPSARDAVNTKPNAPWKPPPLLSISHRGFHLTQCKQRPFPAPHHTASGVALVGGGSQPMPGEISLAHHGVLFLDELPEFDRRVLEVLREPLESGRITISRAARQADFPARLQLVGRERTRLT